MKEKENDLIANIESIVKELMNVCGYSKTHIVSLFLKIADRIPEEDKE